MAGLLEVRVWHNLARMAGNTSAQGRFADVPL